MYVNNSAPCALRFCSSVMPPGFLPRVSKRSLHCRKRPRGAFRCRLQDSRPIVTSPSLEIRETDLSGVFLVVPKIFRDDRGFFLESFNESSFAGAGLPIHFVQDNHSRSNMGVLRGLHS